MEHFPTYAWRQDRLRSAILSEATPGLWPTARRRTPRLLPRYSDFGVPKRCFSFGRGSNVASVPDPTHFIFAL
jgi:hypothetical protein